MRVRKPKCQIDRKNGDKNGMIGFEQNQEHMQRIEKKHPFDCDFNQRLRTNSKRERESESERERVKKENAIFILKTR